MWRILLTLMLIAGPTSAMAEILTYTHTVRQPFSGSQSPDDALTAAVAKAKREVLEKAGTYIDSIKVVKDHQLVQNQILALSSALLKAEVVSQRNYTNGEAFGVEIEARVCVDTGTLEDRIKKFLQDRSSLEKAEKLELRERELLAKISELEQRNRQLERGTAPAVRKKSFRKELSKKYREAVTRLTAIEANRKALELWDGSRFVDSERALTLLNQAIRKDDRFADAFNNRGIVQGQLGKWQEAINNYDMAIRLEPGLAEAYLNRGSAYANLGRTETAIVDLTRAIQLNPRQATALYDRGTALSKLGRYQEAIEDFNAAAALTPCNAAIYYNRGNVYVELGDYLKAIKNFDEAIKADPTNAAFFFNRGVAYANLGHFDRSLADLDQAISLDPKDVTAFLNRGLALFKAEQYKKAISDFDYVLHFRNNEGRALKYRGLCYLMLGDTRQFCADLALACKVGDCGDLEKARSDGYCK